MRILRQERMHFDAAKGFAVCIPKDLPPHFLFALPAGVFLPEAFNPVEQRVSPDIVRHVPAHPVGHGPFFAKAKSVCVSVYCSAARFSVSRRPGSVPRGNPDAQC